MKPAVLSLVFLLSCLLPVSAAPGDILNFQLERSYSLQEAEAFISELYLAYEMPQASHQVDVYQAVVESQYPDGSPARLYLQVFLPRIQEEDALNLYVFGPGSTGLIDNCRPSREHEAGIRWGLYRAHVLSHAMAGTIGIIPDYLGFREAGRDQYYMVAEAEAVAMLDSIRAFDRIRERINYGGMKDSRNFVAGFSQGGHAAFAAAEYRASYAPEVRIDGVIGYGPTTQLETLMLEYPSVIPMMVYTYSRLYGESEFDPALILRDEYAEYLEDEVTSQCVGGMQSYYPSTAQDLFRPEFHKSLLDGSLAERYPSIAAILGKNSVGLRRFDSQVLILQGTEDVVIRPGSQAEFVHHTRAAGNDVDYRQLGGQRHDTRQYSYQMVREWMDSFL